MKSWKIAMCLFLLASIGFLASCGLAPIVGDGVIATNSRGTGSVFDTVETSGNFEVTILTGQNETGVTITTDANLMEYIETETKNGTLFIEIIPFTYLLPTNKIKITVSGADLVEISDSGTGSLFIPAYSAKSTLTIRSSGTSETTLSNFSSSSPLLINSSGTSHFLLSGACPTLNLRSSGTGTVDASGLFLSNAILAISGVSNISLNARNAITGTFSGTGTLTYTGGARNGVFCTGLVNIIPR